MDASRRLSARRRKAAMALSMLTVMTVMAAALSSCNTTAGFGQDMQSAGRGIENSADKNK